MDISTLSSHQIKSLFKVSQEYFYIVGTDGYIKNVNSQFVQNLGYTKNELLSDYSFLDFIHPDDQELSQAQFNNIINGEIVSYFENRLKSKNGSYKWFAWSYKYIKKDDFIFASALDITKQKEAEQQLRNALAENKKIMDFSLDVICSIDEEGRFTQVSKAAFNLWGYEPEELIRKKFIDLVHPDDIDLTNKAAAEIMSGISLTNLENRYIRKDGSIAPISWSARWLETQKTMFCVARDATEKKKQDQQEKQQLSDRLKNIIDNYTDGYFTLSRDWEITEINPSGQKMIGIFVEKLLGTGLSLFPKFKKLKFYTECKRAFQENISVHFEEFSPSFNKWFEVTAYPYENSLTIIFRDITSKKESDLLKLKSEDNYKILFTNNPVPMWAYMDDFNFTMVNDAALAMLGYSRKEFLSLSLFDLRPQDEHKRLSKILKNKAHFIENKLFGEWRFVKKDGTIILIELVSHIIELYGEKVKLIKESQQLKI